MKSRRLTIQSSTEPLQLFGNASTEEFQKATDGLKYDWSWLEELQIGKGKKMASKFFTDIDQTAIIIDYYNQLKTSLKFAFAKLLRTDLRDDTYAVTDICAEVLNFCINMIHPTALNGLARRIEEEFDLEFRTNSRTRCVFSSLGKFVFLNTNIQIIFFHRFYLNFITMRFFISFLC